MHELGRNAVGGGVLLHQRLIRSTLLRARGDSVRLVIFALVATGYAVRASVLLFTNRIDTLNTDFHPKSAKEELKEELDDLAQRQADLDAEAERLNRGDTA